VLVELRPAPVSVFGEPLAVLERTNYVRFRLGPDVAIALGVRSKLGGDEMVGENVELLASRRDVEGMPPYARLLADAMKGDALLFARQDAVEAEWRVVDGVLGDATPIHEYEPGTWGPEEASRIIAPSGGWHTPLPTEHT
jgi:glucose-6-phosphate 1-dehydrogenase